MRLPKLTPIPNAVLPSDFHAAVRMLNRPYLPISREQYEHVKTLGTDVLRMSDGRQVTFGVADGGYALMPLQKKHYFT